MQDNGISFGAHTLIHANLKNVVLEEAEKEIVQSKAMIETKVKTNVRSFAYPFGSKYYDNKIVKLLKGNGFDCAFTTSEKLINQFKFCNIYSLPRISAGNYYFSFAIKASGMFSDFYKIFHS
jgi:peptidoglycan/xylan/chitin deacetylase (PgdA/CDA1 family)